MRKRTLTATLLICALLASLLSGCSASTDKFAGNTSVDKAPEMDMGIVTDTPSAGAPETSLTENRKLIRTVYMDAECEDMETLLPALEEKLVLLGGYVEAREVYSNSETPSQWRRANLTLRVPSDKADQFLTQVEAQSNVTSINETLDDVTLDYVATESRVEALEAEQDRLLELMEQAETLSDLLEIEARLTDVRYELELVTSQLRVFDNQIDYTTIHLSIWQVTQLTPTQKQTVWQRIGNGFMDTLRNTGTALSNIFVWLITSSPVLVLLAIPVVIIVLLVRKHRNKKRGPKPPISDTSTE